MSKALISPDSIRALSRVSPYSNLLAILLDHALVVAVSGGALWFRFLAERQGMHWGWTVPVWGVAMLLNGCLAQRIALMGHEASHHMLVPHRRWNDVLAQLLCFFPLFGTIGQYRRKHLPHHHHPNDPERDPNLANGKVEAHYARFPMPKKSFFLHYYLKFLWPPFVLANLWDLLRGVSLARGARGERKARRWPLILGFAYFILLLLALRVAQEKDWNPLPLAGGLYLVALSVWAALPERLFTGAKRVAIPVKWDAWLRFTFYTVLFTGFLYVTYLTGFKAMRAYLILWIVPLVYMFPYLMILREVYQHANAGQGLLDNSRVMHVDPFTRWALLGYGNDYHLVHHIYPNIPHYRLRETHERLMAESAEYRAAVRETYGISSPTRVGKPSLIQELGRA